MVAIGALTISSSAAAKTFEVTKRTDPPPGPCKPHDCSLREAVRAANGHAGADRVLLRSRKTYNLSIANTTGGEDGALEGDIDITNSPLLLQHPGHGKARINARRIDRVFDVFAGAPTRFVKLVIKGGGHVTSDGFGGGIRSTNANLKLTRTTVTRNRSTNDGGGIGFPQGDGSLILTRSALTDNFSGDDGGGLSFNDKGSGHLVIDRGKLTGNEADDWAGGFITAVRARITRTTVYGNQSDGGSGGGGAIEEPGHASLIKDSTFSLNTADQEGGGLVVDFTPGVTRVVNTTITRNHTASNGGGVWVTDSGAFSLNAATVARNGVRAAGSGGGLFNENTNPFRVENSLIALNHAAATPDDCADGGDPGQGFDSHGHNLLSTLAGCDGFTGPADLVRANPKIGPVGHHGGPTATIPLKRGSAAIGHAKRSTAPNRDQRGHERDKHPDDGAYER
jgi:hypothetical protein